MYDEILYAEIDVEGKNPYYRMFVGSIGLAFFLINFYTITSFSIKVNF
jgi:hypothetical protein